MKKLMYSLLVWLSIASIPAFSQNGGNHLKSLIDTSFFDNTVSPKVDFYRFVNGKWLDQTAIPQDRGSIGMMEQPQRNKFLQAMLLEGKKKYAKGTDQYKAVTLYSMGMDSVSTNKLGMSPLKPQLAQIKKITTIAGFQTYLESTTKWGLNAFFTFEIYPGFGSDHAYALFLLPGNQGLPSKEHYTKNDAASEELRTKYKAHISRMFQLVGYPTAVAETKAAQVYELEHRLASTWLNEEEKRNPMAILNKRSVSQLGELTSKLNWNAYFSKIGIKSMDSLTIFELKYMEEVNKLLTEQNIAKLKDYMEWQVINHAANYLSDDFRKAKHEFYGKILWGTQEMKPRAQSALDVCNGSLRDAVGRIYVEEYFSPAAKAKALEIVGNIKLAYAIRIQNLDWMSEQTKQGALAKLSALQVKIGYPDVWRDYSTVNIKSKEDGGNYYDNILQVSAWEFNRKIKQIGQAGDKTEWYMGAQEQNAVCSHVLTEITFPAGILQPPYFDYQQEDAVNYGGFGAVIGHEISHFFDDIGSQFDSEGNMRDWWAPADKAAFEERKKGLIEQFGNYEPLPGIRVNGVNTLGENIGDLGGVNVAYDAYMIHLSKTGNRTVINGFTPEQRFFMTWAINWRIKYKDETLKILINTDPHSPGMYRAIGPLVNIDAFYTAFGIKEGDPMFIPANKRVKIW